MIMIRFNLSIRHQYTVWTNWPWFQSACRPYNDRIFSGWPPTQYYPCWVSIKNDAEDLNLEVADEKNPALFFAGGGSKILL